MVMETQTFWYRFEEVGYATGLDEWGEPCGPSDVEVHLRKFLVLRETPKGVWLDAWRGPRFVLRDARKRYACPTKEEARVSFIARKKAQIRIYNARIHTAELALNFINDRQLENTP